MADSSQLPKRKDVKLQELGESGTRIFYGIISGEEYNYELAGKVGLWTYDKMRRSDGSVKAALTAIKNPVKSVEWFIEPASADPADIEVADFVKHNIMEILRFKTMLGEILTHLEFGYSVHEKVYEYQPVLGKDRIVLSKLAFRKQTTILRWEQEDHTPGITQWTPDGKSISIPLNKIVVFTNEQEGDNYEGQSILRAAYKHWYYKDKMYQIDAIGHERQALGVVKIERPANADDTQKKAAQAAARNLRANEEAFIEQPTGWNIDFMDMKGGTLKDIEPSIDHHDREISKSVLAQFLDLGAGRNASGSRAVGQTHSELFEESVQSIVDTIADTFNQYVIRDLVDLNFNVAEYPRLKTGDISSESLTDLATAVTQFVTAGLLTPTREDEEHVRSLLTFPDMPDDTEEEGDPGESDPKLDPVEDPGDVKNIDPAVKQAMRLHASLTKRLYDDTARAA
jgi:phage gp29-like protein